MAIVKADTDYMMKEKLPGGVNAENREDTFQEICVAVFKQLLLCEDHNSDWDMGM